MGEKMGRPRFGGLRACVGIAGWPSGWMRGLARVKSISVVAVVVLRRHARGSDGIAINSRECVLDHPCQWTTQKTTMAFGGLTRFATPDIGDGRARTTTLYLTFPPAFRCNQHGRGMG